MGRLFESRPGRMRSNLGLSRQGSCPSQAVAHIALRLGLVVRKRTCSVFGTGPSRSELCSNRGATDGGHASQRGVVLVRWRFGPHFHMRCLCCLSHRRFVARLRRLLVRSPLHPPLRKHIRQHLSPARHVIFLVLDLCNCGFVVGADQPFSVVVGGSARGGAEVQHEGWSPTLANIPTIRCNLGFGHDSGALAALHAGL